MKVVELMNKKIGLLEEIKTLCNKGEINQDTIYFNDIDLTIKLIQLESTSQLMRVDFVMTYNKYNQEINESLLAVGDNETHTSNKLANQFINIILNPIFNVLSDNNSKLISHNILNNSCNFKFLSSEVLVTGEVDGDQSARVYPNGLYDVIKDNLMDYIGFHKVYFVNMLISTTFVNTTVLVKVNGEPVDKLSRILTENANKLDIKSIFYSEQQSIVLWQEGEISPPFDYNSIADICYNIAMPMFEVSTKENYDDIYDKILSKVNDENIARDIFLLVPEILCEIVFESTTEFEDRVTLVNGDKLFEVRTCQLRLYEYIKKAISSYIMENDPSRDAILNAYSFSARYNCIEKALINQTDLSKVANISFALQINDDYTIY